MKPKHNWELIKQTFVVGHKVSLKEIAHHFNVPYQSVRRKAAKEKWTGCKVSYRFTGVYCETYAEQRRIFDRALEDEMQRFLNEKYDL